MSRTQVGTLLADRRRNAAIAWLLVAFLGVAAAGTLFGGETFADGALWAGFIVSIIVFAVVPPVVHRNATRMLPWEVLAMAALPVIGRSFARVELTGDLATYLSVAALALIVAVELHAFTTVRMTYGFAVVFVVVTTMATAGIWAVLRWSLDIALGTQFLLEQGVPPGEIHDDLMVEFIYSTAAGMVAGIVFELYFRRWARIEDRLDLEVDDLV
jgi:hypothetical protein